MIAKGNLHAHGAKLAAYLTANFGDETAELVELRGFAATNIRDAFIDVQMQAAATKAAKPFFHAYVRAPDGETLSPEQWRSFADRLEKELGFEGQPRAIAFHHGADGESHMHLAWSRIDQVSLTAIDPGLYKNKMKQLCRAFENEHGLTQVANERGADVKTKSANRAEFEQSRRLDTDLKEIRNTIHECWQRADNGQAFAAALGEHGLILAKGDRRDFVIVDREGGDHALSKRITGATASVTRGKMADIDRASLPSVNAAKAMQRERMPTQTRAPTLAPAPQASAHAQASKEAGKEPAKESVRIIGGVMRPAAAKAQMGRAVAPTKAPTSSRAAQRQQAVRMIGGVARPAAGVVKTAGKALDSIASAFEGLFGGASKPLKGSAKELEKAPLDAGPAPAKAEQDEALHREHEQQSGRRQKYLRSHSREVPDEKQRDADIERDTSKGRERTRGED